MARRKDSPQKAAMREMMRDYLKNNDISIKDGTDVNSIMRDMMSVILEGALDDILRPLKTTVGVFWAFNQKPETDEQQTIIDLCLLMETAVRQIEYLLEHAMMDGKGIAFASIDPSYAYNSSKK